MRKRTKIALLAATAFAVVGIGGAVSAASASETEYRTPPGHSTHYTDKDSHDGIGNDNNVEVPINVQIWDTLKKIDIF